MTWLLIFLLLAAAAALAVVPAAAGGGAHAMSVYPGMVVAADYDNDRIQVFHPNGTFAFKFGWLGGDLETFVAPLATALAVAPDGRIVVAGHDRGHLFSSDGFVGPYNHTIRVFHPNGTFAFKFGTNGTGDGQFATNGTGDASYEDGISGVAVAPDGRIVVADLVNHRIQVFHPNGTFAFKLGTNGTGDREFGPPSGVAVAPDGRIVVTDGDNVQVFHPNGTFAFQFGAGGVVAVAPDGRIVVTDGDNVQVFHPNGTFDLKFALSGHTSAYYPSAVAVAPDGRILTIGDARFGGLLSVQVFRPDGTFGFSIGGPGEGDGKFGRYEGYGLLRPVGGPSAVAVAPGPAPPPASADRPSAPSCNPCGTGMIVVADSGNHRIQVFHPNGTFAFKFGTQGAGEGQFRNGPYDVAVAPDGRIVVADRYSYRSGSIQVFHPNGTFARESVIEGGGSGTGIAFAPNGRMVVSSSHGNVHVFHPNGTYIAFGLRGAGEEQIQPTDVAVAPDGRIVVADAGNHRIQVFHPNGTFAFAVGLPPSIGEYGDRTGGDADGEFNYPTGVAVAPDGRIVAADYYNDRIQVFHPNGTYAFKFGTRGIVAGGELLGPSGVAVAPDGRIVVTDSGNDRIQVFHPNGTYAFKFGTRGIVMGPFDRPSAVAFTPDGRIVVADADDRDVQVFHPNGTFALDVGRGAGNLLGKFGSPSGVAVAPDGRIVVADPNYGRIQVFRPDGTFAFVFGLRGAGEEQIQPTDVAVAPDGRIVVADAGNHRIQVFHPNGTFAFAVGLPPSIGEYGDRTGGDADGEFNYPTGVAVAPDGRIVAADYYNDRIQVFHPNGTYAFKFGTRGAGEREFEGPTGVAVAPDGRIVVTDSGNDRIQVFHPNGTFAFSTGLWNDGDVRLGYPAAVAVAPDGRIAVADTVHARIHVFHPNGTFAFAVGPPAAVGQFYSPSGVAVAPVLPTPPVNGTAPPLPDPAPVPVDPVSSTPVNDTAPLPSPGAELPTVAVLPNGIVSPPMGGAPPPTAVVLIPAGSSVPGCEEANECNIPENVTVGVGGEVTWTNGDTAAHTVTSGTPDGGPDGIFDSGLFMPDGTYTFTFEEAGAYPYFCIVHPWRIGTVTASDEWLVNDATGVVIDVAGLAGQGRPPLDGSASSTVTFPAVETSVAASFATVTFPPGVAAAHVPAGGRLALRVAADVPDDARVQGALAYEGSGRVTLQRVVEVGDESGRVEFDLPVRILLEGQAGGRAFYIEGGADGGTITPIDQACAADDAARVHRHLGGAGECQMDSANGDKIIYTYHLTLFGTALPERAPPPVVDTCSVSVGTPDLRVSVQPGRHSDPVRQVVVNSGSAPFAHVNLTATPWSGGLPASATEVREDRDAVDYVPLADGTAVADGLGGGDEAPLWFRLNLTPYEDLQGGTTLDQRVTYQAECALSPP